MRPPLRIVLGIFVALALFSTLSVSGLAGAQDDDSAANSETEWTAVVLLFCIGGVWLVGLIFWIWLLTWVFRDAQSRGMSGVLWVLLVLALGLLGIIIYLIARDPVQPVKPAYYPPAKERNRFCVKCGKSIPYDVWVCPLCGHDYRKK